MSSPFIRTRPELGLFQAQDKFGGGRLAAAGFADNRQRLTRLK